jgi:hypothetical protein
MKSFTSLWTRGYLFYTLGYHPIQLYFGVPKPISPQTPPAKLSTTTDLGVIPSKIENKNSVPKDRHTDCGRDLLVIFMTTVTVIL